MIAPAVVDRPMTIGEIVDRAVTLAVRRWRVLGALVLIEAIPLGIGRVAVGESPPANAWFGLFEVLCDTLFFGAAILGCATPPATVGAVLRGALRRYGALIGAELLGFVLLLVVVAGAAACGFVAGLVFGPAGPAFVLPISSVVAAVFVLVFAPRLSLVGSLLAPIVMLEHVSAPGSWSIAFRRTRNAGPRRSWLLGVALLAIAFIPTMLTALGADDVVRLTHLEAVRFVEELLSDAIQVALAATVATVISLELRVRYEGADLEAALIASAPHQENGGASSAAASAAGSE